MSKPALNAPLIRRPRRLRRGENLRALVRENHLRRDDLIMPIFITAADNTAREIASMPGIFQYSLDRVDAELETLLERGITRIMLFGIPAAKDAVGSDTWHDHGIIQRAIGHIKANYPEFYVISDVCFCEFTSHGHCGVVDDTGALLNDPTLENLQKQAISHAQAGADMLAPSGMIDGMIGAMRGALDAQDFAHLPLMSYAVKYASAYYGPFRDAVDSAPQFGDRRAYQMDPANAREAMVEAALDLEEGADILMVKPALAYLDIVRQVRDRFDVPVAAYNVSGEYAMVKAAAEKGWVDGDAVALESLLSMKRAGADIILTYFARDIALLLP
ncbi:porphobilinogen synthase [Bradymonas sediminis]|uniref:Delta-aminolevulinic acid dehydratase n=1 Tax=Bradymonas sediminis TaxID=1548548 RepID=A0A2Z4FKS6_9DELT|nr:porphobilinogen synthase [Bradymonas sediminis]AWV89569.1 porphobilinogen synthase [Bradymonas sediminis]TDP76697.1 porphobilinogen synthase [Bradymonas sediminis]